MKNAELYELTFVYECERESGEFARGDTFHVDVMLTMFCLDLEIEMDRKRERERGFSQHYRIWNMSLIVPGRTVPGYAIKALHNIRVSCGSNKQVATLLAHLNRR